MSDSDRKESPARPAIKPRANGALRPLIKRLWSFDRRWAADTFSREKLWEAVKTLAWVAPLTVLIWIYAEREQVSRKRSETIPFELISLDKNKLVSLKPPQDSNVIIDCEGPRARVEEVLRLIRVGRSRMPGLDISVDPRNASSEIQLNLAERVANHPLFTQNGITVTRCQPERANVLVDPIIERDAHVAIPPSINTLEAATAFDPPVIKITAPQSLILQAEQQWGGGQRLVVYARLQDRPELNTPGERPVADLPLDLPPALRNNDRVQLSQTRVDAVLHVRRPDIERKMPSMVVQSTVPYGFGERYEVRYDPSLPDVTLIGPADEMKKLDLPGAEQPYARFSVSSADAGEVKMKPLEFAGLPDGVRVSDKDRVRQIRVEVVSKSATDVQ